MIASGMKRKDAVKRTTRPYVAMGCAHSFSVTRVVVLMAVAAACSHPSAGSETTRKAQVAACAKEGDRCEVVPGKIGLCTAREGSSSLTCVSLH